MVSAGQILSLTIEKPAAGGRMIARVDGQVVLVAGAIPGERVTARIERMGRGVAYADVVSVDEVSQDRRTAGEDPQCGGCIYSHITPERQRGIKALVIEDALGRIGRIPVPPPIEVAASPEEGYRMRARLHARGARIGFFREGTHDLCDPRITRQLRPDTCDVLDRLAAGLRSLGVSGHELELSENVDASERAVHVEVAGPLNPRTLGGLAQSDGLTGLSASLPRGHGHVVIAGDPHVTDVLAVDGREVRLKRHVLSFFQGNRYLLAPLVSHVVAHIAPGSVVVDLYAGAGLFSVAAASVRDARTIAVEGDRAGARDLAMNAASTGDRVTAVHEPVESFVARQHDTPAVLIVDPPRTGMSAEALQGALRLQAPTLVYVSCDVATFARDARKIVDAGYVLEQVRGFDLFPNTPHVESVASFRFGR